MGGSSKGGGSVNLPKPPKVDKAYGQGVDVYLKHLDELLTKEQSARNTYDPQRIQEQQDLQNKFGSEQYREQLSALNQLDPQFVRNRAQLGNSIYGDLGQGTHLTPGESTELQQQVRGSQAARGNVYGDAPGIAEAYTLGDRGQQLYQQRLQNAGGFVGMPTMASQVGQVSPITADRNAAYADPNAGWQGLNAANGRYQALASAKAAGGGGSQPGWVGASGSIVGGILGYVYGGPAGGQIGSSLGNAAASSTYSLSDRRAKTDIKKVGKDGQGMNLYEFAYKGPKHVGYMAHEVAQKYPGDAFKDPVSGYRMVSPRFAPVRTGA